MARWGGHDLSVARGFRVLSSHAVLRFPFPLIEPDVRVSRIRLSDKDSRVRTRVAAAKQRQSHQTQMCGEVVVGVAGVSLMTFRLVLLTQPLTEPCRHMGVHGLDTKGSRGRDWRRKRFQESFSAPHLLVSACFAFSAVIYNSQ